MVTCKKTRKPSDDSRNLSTIDRRGFCRWFGAIVAGGGLDLHFSSAQETLAGGPVEQESRLVRGHLRSWQLNPRLSRLEVAFRFLERSDLKDLEVGRHSIDDKAYAMIAKSTSLRPELVQFEAHREYIDVHYMISGQSIIGFSPIEKLEIATSYQPAEDSATYNGPDAYQKIKMYPGSFAVFFPGGGHMPNCNLDGSHELHTAVVKVRHNS